MWRLLRRGAFFSVTGFVFQFWIGKLDHGRREYDIFLRILFEQGNFDIVSGLEIVIKWYASGWKRIGG